MNFLGLDIGTTRCKVGLFDDKGLLLQTARREYTVDTPQLGWAEQNIEMVWNLAKEAMQEAIYNAGVREVAALALSVHGEAVTPVDADGSPLRPTILGMDTRTESQNDWLRHNLGAEELYQHTGMPIHTNNTLPKLLWIKENEPDIWNAAARFLLVEDFLINKMSGEAVISSCLASRTQLFDLGEGVWSAQVLEPLELDPSRLAKVLPSGCAAGVMAPVLAASLGLGRAPLIVTGGHVQACSALGVGLTVPGLAMVSAGFDMVGVVLGIAIVNQTFFENDVQVCHHVVPDTFLGMAHNHCGSQMLRWFRDHFCEPQMDQSAQPGTDAYDLILNGAPDGPTDLLLLPQFSDVSSPTFDTAAKGAILGLTFNTPRADIAKAIIEGLTYELNTVLDLLKFGGAKVNTLHTTCREAKSQVWSQLMADVTAKPVVIPCLTQASELGAALLAGIGVGFYTDAAQAVEKACKFEERLEPQPGLIAAYQSRFEDYRRLYPTVKELSHLM